MKDFRCQNCNRLLARIEGMCKVEIKCPRCKGMSVYSTEEIFITIDQKKEVDSCSDPEIAES
ncbi:MAG: Com family DNA-binding transcriptional regulator [Candidatus Margulisiibacteriota bacterium]|nr:Com family DNA-binding transcriptional regulator [Candidatus Margulisiibacteriota bacterium]